MAEFNVVILVNTSRRSQSDTVKMLRSILKNYPIYSEITAVSTWNTDVSHRNKIELKQSDDIDTTVNKLNDALIKGGMMFHFAKTEDGSYRISHMCNTSADLITELAKDRMLDFSDGEFASHIIGTRDDIIDNIEAAADDLLDEHAPQRYLH